MTGFFNDGEYDSLQCANCGTYVLRMDAHFLVTRNYCSETCMGIARRKATMDWRERPEADFGNSHGSRRCRYCHAVRAKADMERSDKLRGWFCTNKRCRQAYKRGL